MRYRLLLILMIVSTFFLKSETFVVCVGIATYADATVKNLTKTEKDAKAIADFYKKGTENVITITGRYATKEQIIKSLRSQFGRAKEDDKIIFYFSGHGYPGGFCPYDMTKAEDGLSYAEVIKVMSQSKAKDKMIFADACNSGAIRQSKGTAKPDTGNVMMFLSSRGNEYSIESPMLSNGYFTNYLLHGLGGKADANRDRTITAKELYNYVSSGVTQLSGGKQHPVMWGSFPDNLVIVKFGKKLSNDRDK
ncbi:MAG: caspase family protein [Muribaculaceae bacterium]|nr:caspase family protein [Muribaculaceae bacterium]